MSFTCDLITPTVSARSKAGKAAGKVETKLSCPSCHANDTTSLVNQRYICQNDPSHGPFEQGELTKAMATADGTYKTIGTTAEVDAVRKDHGDKAKKVVNFTAHPADDVLNSTLPGDKSWVVRPTSGDAAFQAMLAVLTESGRIPLDGGDAVLLAPAVLGSAERLVRAERWGEQLLIREVLWPSELKDGLAINDTPPDPRIVEPVRKFVETFTVDFDPEHYQDTTNDRLRAFGLARIGDDGATVVAMPDSVGATQESTVDDLMAALEAVVAGAA